MTMFVLEKMMLIILMPILLWGWPSTVYSIWRIQPPILGKGQKPSGSAQISAWSHITVWIMGLEVPEEGSA